MELPEVVPRRIAPADSAPLGAKVLSVLHVLLIPVAGFLLMNALLYSLWPAWAGGAPSATILRVTGISVLLIAVFVTIVATAYGLWTVEPWAWVLSLLSYGLALLASLVQFERVPAVIATGILIYLWLIGAFYGFDVGQG